MAGGEQDSVLDRREEEDEDHVSWDDYHVLDKEIFDQLKRDDPDITAINVIAGDGGEFITDGIDWESGGVAIASGTHLKALRIEIDIERMQRAAQQSFRFLFYDRLADFCRGIALNKSIKYLSFDQSLLDMSEIFPILVPLMSNLRSLELTSYRDSAEWLAPFLSSSLVLNYVSLNFNAVVLLMMSVQRM